MENQNLCGACQIVLVKFEKIQMYRHTLGGFQDSATNGCYFCAMRWHRLSLKQRSELLQYEHQIMIQCHGKVSTFSQPMLSVRYALEVEGEYSYIFEELPLVAKLDFALVPAEGRLATPRTLSLMGREMSQLTSA